MNDDEPGESDGFDALSPELRPEVRELAVALRRLLRMAKKSQRQFASTHHVGLASVSRYLSGKRIPDKYFLDALMKAACRAHGEEVGPELQGRIYQLHREALLAAEPARYQEQVASDRLEDAVLREEELELELRELRTAVAGQKQQLRTLESQLRQLRSVDRQRDAHRADLERYRTREEELEAACARLREETARLERALRDAEAERDAARARCQELEEELATASDAAQRAELARQEREQRLRLARAAEVAEHRLADLERVHEEAERVRLAAAGDAAAEVERARVKAEELLREATARATTVRPQVVRRSAALRQMREATERLAYRGFGDRVERLTRAGTDELEVMVPPIGITGPDDIGRTARAVDELQREAVRQVAEQVLLRRHTVAAVAVLARRSQALVARQLDVIARWGAGDERLVPALGHLANRARRCTEELLVITGEGADRDRRRSVGLDELFRAAAGEVEQPERVELGELPLFRIFGPHVVDVVHLLAELLENGLTYSAPHTAVRVVGVVLGDGRVLLEVHDAGLGISAPELVELNQRLATAPAHPAVADPGRVGLFLVGLLARRHGVRVQLRPGDPGGVVALVMLPADILVPGTANGGQPAYTDAGLPRRTVRARPTS